MTIEFKTIERIERLIEGDLSASERSLALAELKDSEELQAHYEAVKEMRSLLHSAFDDAAARAPVEQISGSVVEHLTMQDVRDAELEMLAMARFDGEQLSERDNEAVDAYIDAHPQLLEGVREVREFSRMPIEAAADRVDFNAFSGRIMARISEDVEQQASERPAVAADTPGIWSRLGAMFRGPGPALAAVAGAAVAVAVLVPALNNDGPLSATPDQPQVVNNYFMTTPPEVENVRYEQGYWGAVTPGDDINSPVIWIQAEEPELLDGETRPTMDENDRGL